MISLFIFYIHTVAAAWLFTTRWQESDVKEGILAVGFRVLVFSVGWSISTVLLSALIAKEGFGPLLDRDALSLLLLALMEGVFFSVQTRTRRRRQRA